MKKVISRYITKILLSIIFTLSILIYASHSSKNKAFVNKYFFEDNLNFMSFNNWYTKLTNYKEKSIKQVSGDYFDYYSKEDYLNGQAYEVEEDTLINAFASGIVVYSGNKEDFNNTIIIQGSDGYDIWYGNLDTISVNIYDYLNKGDLIGKSLDKVYILITKDGNYYTYEEYLKNK